MGNVVRKLQAKFRRASLIRKCLKSGNEKSYAEDTICGTILAYFSRASKFFEYRNRNRSVFRISKCGFWQRIRIAQENI